MKKIITYGTFDMLHEGHINILKCAKKRGDYLIVGVTGDQYDRERGKLNVEESLEQRMENVRSTGLADKIIVELAEGQKISDIQKYAVDEFVIGSDWLNKFEYLKEYCSVVYLPRTANISSTQLRKTKYEIVKIGIVGAGRIAKRFVPESKFVSGCEVVGICSLHKDSAENFANNFELSFCTTDYKELLEKSDAIYIATPHNLHYEMIKQALKAKTHVLCEKPIVLSTAELQELYDLADENNVVLTEAIKTAYAPGFLRLVEVAKSGIIGNIKDVDACFTKLISGNLRELDQNFAGGSVNELATYPLVAIVELLGAPIHNTFCSHVQKGVDLFTRGQLIYKTAIANFKVGLGVKSDGALVITGTNGYIYVPAPWWLTQEFEVRYEDQNQNKKHFYKFDGDGLRYELSEFINQIRKGEKECWKLKRKTSSTIISIIEDYHQKRSEGKVSLI